MQGYKLSVLQIMLGVGALLLAASPASAETPPTPTDNWLLDAPDDSERFNRIERMFGGFSTAMIVVGQRYDQAYDAIVDGNLPLAEYHWKRIREAIELGYLRRPGRKGNAIAIFLEGPWQPLAAALAERDPDQSKQAFLAARDACMACHIAERVPFMNDQPRFRRTAGFPES